MRKSSTEIYRGQRNKEKRELFGRFRVRAIEKLYKQKFFDLFDSQCFKCGTKEKPFPEIGKPPVLCIDHHIPMALGGHLVPGNLVSLCRKCNEKKLDLPPEEFYTQEELERLAPILCRQSEIFEFTFDYEAWQVDREKYLICLGVPTEVVQGILFDPDHPEYIGVASESKCGIAITIDMEDLLAKSL